MVKEHGVWDWRASGSTPSSIFTPYSEASKRLPKLPGKSPHSFHFFALHDTRDPAAKVTVNSQRNP
jgi:hypothetical protein